MVSLQLKLHFCAKFRKYRVKHYGWYAVHNVFICCTAAHSWPSEEVFCAVCFVYCLLINQRRKPGQCNVCDHDWILFCQRKLVQ